MHIRKRYSRHILSRILYYVDYNIQHIQCLIYVRILAHTVKPYGNVIGPKKSKLLKPESGTFRKHITCPKGVEYVCKREERPRNRDLKHSISH